MSVETVFVDPADLPVERFADSSFGTVHWRTVFCGDRTPTEAMTCGLASLETGDYLALHRHAPPEIYFGVSGTARVVIDGVSHVLRPGTAVFIPGNAVHGIFAEDGPASFFYVFATDRFSEVEYNILPDIAPDAAQAMAVSDAAEPVHPLLDGLDITPAGDTPAPN